MVARRTFLSMAPALAAAGLPGVSFAQSRWPERVIRIIVANPPGGTDDAISRFVAAKLGPELGQPVIVENRGGASTTIGGAAVGASPADGYTLLCLISAGIAQTALRDKLSYSLQSFTPVAGVGGFPLGLAVSLQSKITNIEELAAAAKTGSGVTFGSGGVGTMAHLNTTRLLNALQVKGTHVPYKNNPEALQAVTGGFIHMMLASASEVAPLRADGKMRVIAVTSEQRLAMMPDVPTTKELGFPQINPVLWHGFAAPAGTPPEIVARLADGIGRAIRDADFQSRFKPLAFQDDIKSGPALAQYLAAEQVRWREVIVSNGIKVDD